MNGSGSNHRIENVSKNHLHRFLVMQKKRKRFSKLLICTCTSKNVTNSSKTKTKTGRVDELSSNSDFGSYFTRFPLMLQKIFLEGRSLKPISALPLARKIGARATAECASNVSSNIYAKNRMIFPIFSIQTFLTARREASRS